MRIKTRRWDDEIARTIIAEMDSREKMLLRNPAILGAMYLDPRYQRALTDEERTTAIFFLKKLYKKIEAAERKGNDVVESSPMANESAESNSFEEISSYLDTIQNEMPAQHLSPSTSDIEQLINNFYGQRTTESNVLTFWEKQKTASPELYKLASAVFSIPPTQTTVERCFSALAIVLSARRTTLNDKTLQNILINRLNKSIYEKL